MILLEVRHRTLYRYAQPVTFGQHRAMLRPRGGHDLRVRSSQLTISPKASVRWIHDVFSNSVTLIDFEETGDHLLIESALEVEHYAVERPELILSPGTETYPFSYVPRRSPTSAGRASGTTPTPSARSTTGPGSCSTTAARPTPASCSPA